MAERSKGISFDQVMRDLKAGKLLPVYLLMGEESYFIDQITDFIANNVLKPEERDFNQSVLFGADVTAAQVILLCREYPMMATRRVVIIKEAQGMRQLDMLEKYVRKPVSSTVLVIAYKGGTVDRRKKIVAASEASGVVFESKKFRQNGREQMAFIENYLKSRQATIDEKSKLMVAEHVGTDLSRLASELDKVVISLPDNDRRVTPEIVEREIGVSKEYNSFELRDALIHRDVLKANKIIKYFNNNPKPSDSKSRGIFGILPLLFSYFQNLMLAYYTPGGKTQSGIAAQLGLRQLWQADAYIEGMRNYSAMKVMQIIDKMRVVEAKSKGLDNPNTSLGDLLKELIFFILH